MAHYQTAQRRILIDFFNMHADNAFSVEELYRALEKIYKKEEMPGKSTVYRLVQHLVSEGTVKRTLREHSRKMVYQLSGGEHCAFHLHMKCTDCGRLWHMDDNESMRIMSEVLEKNSFKVDGRQTVLVGKCRDCEN